MSKEKTPEIPITYDANLNEGTAELTTELNGHDFVIRGDEEELYDLATRIVAENAPAPVHKPKPVQAVKPAVRPLDQYTDFSALQGRQVLRMKAQSFIYDRLHGTNMLDLLTDRINADRDVAFARSLGLLGVTHCAKHEKAVSKLRQLV